MATISKHLIGMLVVFSFVSGAALASPNQFGFKATVDYTDGSLPGVIVGTQFLGNFSYDPVIKPAYSDPMGAYYLFGLPSQIVANVAGHQVASSGLGVAVINNFGGNVEDGVAISGGNPLWVDGVQLPNGSFGFTLHSKPGNTDVLTSNSLPSNYNVSAFDAHSSMNYGWLQRDGSQSGTILQFSVTSIAALVPEPETYAMFLAGLGLMGGIARCRKQK